MERGLRVERWRRYGKDRLYVNDSTGQRIGWVDRDSGERTIEVPVQRGEFDAAVAAFEAKLRGEAPSSELPAEPSSASQAPASTHSVVDTPTAPDWRDLALHRPGQLAREQAETELAAMRGRSKVGTFIARAVDMKTDERAWRV